MSRAAPAALPPRDLPGLDPAWSRLVEVADADGAVRGWHLLDGEEAVREVTGAAPVGVLLAVHGNPTWSYTWRSLVPVAAQVGWRVVAVDQLDMGFSERTGTRRRLARRLDDLCRLTDALGIAVPTAGGAPVTPVVTVGHDWGGVVSAGWAAAHREALAGLVLLNTAVHQPAGARVPAALRPATGAALRPFAVSTPGFVLATLATARRPLPGAVRAAYRAPYAGAARREGIGAFVADIPASPDHPSRPALDAVAAGLADLGGAGVPSLLVWGPADPVFRPRYLRDLRERLPGGDVQLVAGAGHLVVEDADVAGVVVRWLAARVAAPPAPVGTGRPRARLESTGTPRATGGTAHRPLTAALAERREDDGPAVVQLRRGAAPATVSWCDLARRVEELATGLAAAGVRDGARVALLVPPGPDLTAAFCACLRAGAVVVVADAGLGVAGLSRAVRSASPDVVLAAGRGLAAAAALGWPGRRIAVGALPGRSSAGRALSGDALPRRARLERALGVVEHLDDVAARGRALLASGAPLPPEPDLDAEAAVLFTSGSTGPAKGVVQTQRGLAALRDVLAATYDLGPTTPLVAAFAPFALLGPLLGAVTAVPETDVTAPDTLTATALADAVAAIGARAVFASPAALAAVVATASALTPAHHAALDGVRLLLSAGAPVGTELLAAAAALVPAASARTPYGMTEALPVTDVSLEELLEAGPGDGVLVGAPVPGVGVRISPLDADGAATGAPAGAVPGAAGPSGEVLVAGPHVLTRYDQLWDVHRASSRDAGWHRTGDVGRLDERGRLWVQGRLAHVLTTAAGPVTPVGPEQRVQALPAVARAALVGVGPAGTQQPVVVLEAAGTPHGAAPDGTAPDGAPLRPGPAPLSLVDAVRAAAATPVPVAAVLVVASLPTDVRHRSKIDRSRVAAWAEEVLAGRARAARTPW